MSTYDVVSVGGSLVAVLVICTLPALGSLRGAGPRYRAAVKRQLAVGWAAAAVVGVWMVLGGYALGAGPRWWGLYCKVTQVMLLAYPPLLFVFIRSGLRAAAAAQTADRPAA